MPGVTGQFSAGLRANSATLEDRLSSGVAAALKAHVRGLGGGPTRKRARPHGDHLWIASGVLVAVLALMVLALLVQLDRVATRAASMAGAKPVVDRLASEPPGASIAVRGAEIGVTTVFRRDQPAARPPIVIPRGRTAPIPAVKPWIPTCVRSVSADECSEFPATTPDRQVF